MKKYSKFDKLNKLQLPLKYETYLKIQKAKYV